ncbi:organic cation/carnitine transporter 7-like [Phragmites australis]|uniref:organic cation/carnitine transporter 7-like n=1 Tax=Phragmites australis TaxID=29695 RepID=UPI002D76BA1E|nr:organic cation/carnitine transporter 7-like [Phragmites australis]
MAGGGSGGEAYTTDEALSRLGFGRFQVLLLGFLGTGWVADAMEVMLLSFVGPSVKEEWGVSGGEEGLITSVVFAGMLLGACVGGLGSDRYGRRAGFLFTALVSGIPGFLCAFSPNYATLLALRFLVGLGLGASHVLPTWFLEFVPAENRGFWIAVFTCFWTFGTILEALLAWAIMPILGWRWLLALSSSPCFILLIFSTLVPESPRYLCSRGKISEAMLVLERIARMNNRALPPGILTSDPKGRVDNNLDASVTTVLIMPEDSPRIDDTSSKSNGINAFLALWSRDLIRSTLLLWLVTFASFIAYFGIILLTSELSNGKRTCGSVGPHLMRTKDSSLYINVLVTSFAEFPGLLLAALLVDRIGRRVSLGGMILLCCAFLAPLMQWGGGLAITLLFCARTCIMGCFAILHVYSPEIYPTWCRNTGVGVAHSIGRIGSIVGPLVTTTLLENCGQKEAVIVIDVALFLAGVACALFPLETKGHEM